MEYKDRKKDILDILYANGRVSVLQLAKTLFVSEMTIRRDLSEMEVITGSFISFTIESLDIM